MHCRYSYFLQKCYSVREIYKPPRVSLEIFFKCFDAVGVEGLLGALCVFFTFLLATLKWNSNPKCHELSAELKLVRGGFSK